MEKGGDSRAALPDGVLLAPQWIVSPSRPLAEFTSVLSKIYLNHTDHLIGSKRTYIRRKQDDAVVVESLLLQGTHDFAYGFVHSSDHGGVHPPSLIFDLGILLLRLLLNYKCFENEEGNTRLMSSGGACSGVWGAVRARYRKSGLSLKLAA